MQLKQIFPPSEKAPKTVRKIFFGCKDSDDANQLNQWIRSELIESEQNKLFNFFRICCGHTHPALHHSEQRFVFEFDKIYAIKIHQVRLYGFHRGNDFIIIHFLRKKKNKLSKIEIEKIDKKYKDCNDEHLK